MTVSNFFGDLQYRIKYLEHRQQVLNQNIVNNDTPGYQAEDLDFKARVKATQSAGKISQSHPKHLPGTGIGSVGGFEVKIEKNPFEISPNGNTVSLEQQHLKMAETADEHELATKIYRDGLAMHRFALGKN